MILVVAIVFAVIYHEQITMWLASIFHDDDHNNKDSEEEENK